LSTPKKGVCFTDFILFKAGSGFVGSNAVSQWTSKCFIEFVQARAIVDVATGHADSDVMKHLDHEGRTGWRRHIGSPKLLIIFHKRAIKYRSLLRKMTCKDKGSYESSPPCIARARLTLMHELLDHQSPSHAHYHTLLSDMHKAQKGPYSRKALTSSYRMGTV